MRGNIVFLILFVSVIFLSSCKQMYPTQMLRTGRNYQYSKLPDQTVHDEYRLAPNDEVSIMVTTNNGEKMLDPSGMGGSAAGGAGNTYMVEFDGTINIPVLRRIPVAGLTLRETEKLLEEKLTYYFNNPYVKVKVTNNRVIIFPGGQGGTAQVLKLENPNTTLFEALAQAGGISEGKAYRIKLIRGDPSNRKIYKIDLSTIEGLKQADMVLMANDIIYIEPLFKIPQTVITQVSPYLALISTLLVIYALFR
ncbi:MAG: polysaccharide biosynthesis/export family protein [Bacteroidetes bacterium]|nr:polysaccharide biosynthesis/export family protein [Bacteroidota bacterium]